MLGETENQFSLTRAALSTCGRAKGEFLYMQPPTLDMLAGAIPASTVDG